MKPVRTAALIVLTALSLAACRNDNPPPVADTNNDPETLIGKAIKEATDQARKEIATGDIDLSAQATGLPKAAITPAGDLIIGGKTVAMTAEQRTAALEYRKEIAAVAEAGIAVGIEGADLAGKAIKESIKGIFTGDERTVEERIKSEAKPIETAARKICERLPSLLAAQNKLVDAVPEFKPYAKMDASDIRDCNSDSVATDEERQATQEKVRNEIREGIRQSIREGVQATAVGVGASANAAEEAEQAVEGADASQTSSAKQN